jgi:hypothetical protein
VVQKVARVGAFWSLKLKIKPGTRKSEKKKLGASVKKS